MKKFLFVLVLPVFLLVPFSVSAQTSVRIRQEIESNNEVRQNIRATVSAEAREKIEEREQKREELRERLEGKRLERITKFFNLIVQRLEAASERLQKLIDRIGDRIAKYKEEKPGADLTQEEAGLKSAQDALAEVIADIAALKTDVAGLLSSDDPKGSFEAVRESLKGIKDSLVKIHRDLVKVIGDLKGLRVGNES